MLHTEEYSKVGEVEKMLEFCHKENNDYENFRIDLDYKSDQITSPKATKWEHIESSLSECGVEQSRW